MAESHPPSRLQIHEIGPNSDDSMLYILLPKDHGIICRSTTEVNAAHRKRERLTSSAVLADPQGASVVLTELKKARFTALQFLVRQAIKPSGNKADN